MMKRLVSFSFSNAEPKESRNPKATVPQEEDVKLSSGVVAS